MYRIIWVLIVVGIAIYQLSMSPGRTELRGAPFDNERSPKPPTRPQRVGEPRAKSAERADAIPRQPTLAPASEPAKEAAPQPVLEEPQLTTGEEPAVQLALHDLWQGIILSEILSKPRAYRKVQR